MGPVQLRGLGSKVNKARFVADGSEAIIPSVPWESQWECLQMLRDGHDMRSYEAGHLVESPFGDCLDVLAHTADSKTLQKYPVILLGGEQELSGEKAGRLLDYLQAGGTVIASITQLSEEIKAAAGIRVTANSWYGAVLPPYDYDLTESVETGEKFGGMRYEYTTLEVKKGKVLGVNHRKFPLIWEVPCCGKGKIVLTGVTYSQDYLRSGILSLFKHIFGRYIRKHLLALAEPSTLELIVNCGEGFLLVAAFNNTAQPWRGKVTVKLDGVVIRMVKVQETWNETSIFTGRAGKTLSFNDSIPVFEFKVYRVDSGHLS